MSFRSTILLSVSVLLASAIIAACGGGGDEEEVRPGELTNPRDVPTVTPWPSPPEIVVIDPNAIQPLPSTGPPIGSDGEASPSPSAAVGNGQCPAQYTVVSGDSPSVIAERCGVTTEQILEANPGLDPRAMFPGQVINIPGGG
jgi:nucleoid-associated protein YgaU